jgi:hypothetical protein
MYIQQLLGFAFQSKNLRSTEQQQGAQVRLKQEVLE